MDSTKTLHCLADEAAEATMRLGTTANVVAEQIGSCAIDETASSFLNAGALMAKFAVLADRMGIGDVPYECDEGAFRATLDDIYKEINDRFDRYLATRGDGDDE